MMFWVLALVCLAASSILLLIVLTKLKCKTSRALTTSIPTVCQTCINNCGQPPKYPNTDPACNTYNECIFKCNASLHCQAQTLTCGCPYGCQQYFSYDSANGQVFYPGVCMVGNEPNGVLCQPYPPAYTLKCEDHNTTSPGICTCTDNYGYLFGPIVDAKPGLTMDCSQYPNTQAVCGCINRGEVIITDTALVKK